MTLPDNALAGQTIVLTGGTSGIGQCLLPMLAAAGAKVVLIVRDAAKAHSVIDSARRNAPELVIDAIRADLSDLQSVASAVREINDRYESIDGLINNAGAVKAHFATSAQGFEMTMAINHLAVAALTLGLLMVNSIAHRSATRSLNDPETLFVDWRTSSQYSAMRSYARSKLVNLMWARALASRADGAGLSIHAVHPGPVRTDIGRELPAIVRWAFNTFIAIPPQQAAAYVAAPLVSPFDRSTNLYFEKDRKVEPATIASDPRLLERCWQATSDAIGSYKPALLNQRAPSGRSEA